MSSRFQKVPVMLSMTGEQHAALKQHLFPGDGKEAAAIALCGHRAGNHRHRLVVQEVYGIPYDVCSVRNPAQVSWPTEHIEPWLEKAEQRGLSIAKIHSHPTGYPDFSETDDIGDRKFLPAVQDWIEADIPHASAVMLPSGEMFGRFITRDGIFIPLRSICVVGSDFQFWHSGTASDADATPGFTASHAQAFGVGTTKSLAKLRIAVIGCSGTGSPTAEQLVRLGVGELLLVDDDILEDRNVNRILNSTMADVVEERYKAEMLAAAIERMGLGTRVTVETRNLWHPEVVRQVAECDVVFGCMDTVDGRYLLNRLATYYNLPYFDVGVRLDARPDSRGGWQIREVCGCVHYLQPGRSSLMSRGLFTMQQVAEAGLKRNDPTAYTQNRQEGYIKGVEEHRPAVISVNMVFSGLIMKDFLARLHPFREYPNSEIASFEVSLSSLEFFPEPEGEPCQILSAKVGQGDVEPLLDLPELSEGEDQ